MESNLTIIELKMKLQNAGILNNRIAEQIDNVPTFVKAQAIAEQFFKLKSVLDNYDIECKNKKVEAHFDFSLAKQNLDKINIEDVDKRFQRILNQKPQKNKKKQKVQFANKVPRKVKASSFEDNWLSKTSIHKVEYVGIMYNQ